MQWSLAAAILAGCSGSGAPDDVQSAAAEFAPGLQLGARASQVGADRYDWVFAPYVGYADTTFNGPFGFDRVYLVVDESLNSERDEPSVRAVISSISLETHHTQVVGQARGRLKSLLGEPQEICFGTKDGRTVRSQHWPRGPRGGVVLAASELDGQYSALTFGMNADTAGLVSGTGPCSTAGEPVAAPDAPRR